MNVLSIDIEPRNRMKEIKITKWEASDGSLFDTEDQCLRHENFIRNSKRTKIQVEITIDSIVTESNALAIIRDYLKSHYMKPNWVHRQIYIGFSVEEVELIKKEV